VTLLVTHDSLAGDDNNSLMLQLRYYVILTAKREFYPRLIVEKKPGKFRTVSTVTPVGLLQVVFFLKKESISINEKSKKQVLIT